MRTLHTNIVGDKWLGSPVQHFKGSLKEISKHIPSFDRRPFSANSNGNVVESQQNKNLDVIVRERMRSDNNEIPVGVVSKRYQLIQHQEILGITSKTLADFNFDIDKLECELGLTEYGERMRLCIKFPSEYKINIRNDDNLIPQLLCFNSVDRSTKLWVIIGWFRFVCNNGMVVGNINTNYRSRHNRQIDIPAFNKLINSSIKNIAHEKEIIIRWEKTHFNKNKLNNWVNGPLLKQWKVKAATRAYHIIKTGTDVEMIPPFERIEPTEKQVKKIRMVPGCDGPAKNFYDISQALSWLASQRNDIEQQIAWQQDIPSLIASFPN